MKLTARWVVPAAEDGGLEPAAPSPAVVVSTADRAVSAAASVALPEAVAFAEAVAPPDRDVSSDAPATSPENIALSDHDVSTGDHVAPSARFTPKDGVMRVEEALALLHSVVAPLDRTEDVPLAQALNRVLAEDVVAPRDVPPHDYSAMDGYGFAAAARPAQGALPLVGSVAAGHPFAGTVPPGAAVRILTGAPMPAGCDAVAMQEECVVADRAVTAPMLRPGANVRKAGEDVAAGSTVLNMGQRLRPQELGLAAALGRAHLRVYSRVRAAVFSTGDEIREPGSELLPGCIYDANRTTASAMLRSLGCDVTDLGILPDNQEIIAQALADAAQSHDLILTSGGISVGDEDHVKAAVLTCGSLHFWRLAIKPGRPIALGEVAGVPFIGLPGNPVAVMVAFMLIARPLALRLMGVAQTDVSPRYRVEAGFSFPHKPGRREWLRARVRAEGGRLVAEKFPSEGSGILSSMVWSDGLVEVPEESEGLAPGDWVSYIPYTEMLT